MGFFKDDSSQRPDGREKLSYDVNTPDVPKEYEGLLNANPYTNLDYKQSGWQKLMSRIGFRTDYDAYKEGMQVQANEYAAGIAQMAFENEFNSPAASAGRMRAAGQNPDLLGTGDVAESASPPDDNSVPTPSSSDAAQVSGFANMIFSAFSMATGFAKDLKTLHGLQLANDNQEIGNIEGVISTAQDFITQHLPSKMPHSDEDWGNAYSELIPVMEGSYKPVMSKRMYRRFTSEVSSLWDSLPRDEKAYQMYLSKIKNKQEAHILENSRYYDEQGDVLDLLVKPLVELNDRYIAAMSKRDAVGMENEASTEEAASSIGLPELEVSERASEARENIQEFNMQRELRSTLSGIIHSLRQKADSNGRGAGFADTMLLVLSVLSMMNMSSSSTSGVNSKGAYNSSTRSIGF